MCTRRDPAIPASNCLFDPPLLEGSFFTALFLPLFSHFSFDDTYQTTVRIATPIVALPPVSAVSLIQPTFPSSYSPRFFFKMHLGPFQTVLVAFALVAHSTAGISAAQDQCRSTSPTSLLDQQPDDGPSASSSTLAVWSERLLSLLDPNDADHPGALHAFANDLHLAFMARRHAAQPSHKRRKRHPDSELLRRAGTQKVTKCKLQSSGLGSPHGDGGSKPTSTTLPGMTPTDSDGKPLPTQTVSEGHGGSGRETIAVTEPCGNIPVGASSTRSRITYSIIADRLS